MNTQPRHPKCRALPVELHPDIQFLPLYHDGEENQRFFCLWSFLWSKPLLCRFRQSGKIQQTQVLQGFAAFHNAPSRIPPRHSQSRRATNCATPGYSVYLSGWSYSPKASALPTALHPDTVFTLHRKSVFDSPNSILDFGRKVNRPVAYPARIAYNKNITQYIKERAL